MSRKKSSDNFSTYSKIIFRHFQTESEKNFYEIQKNNLTGVKKWRKNCKNFINNSKIFFRNVHS